MYKSHIKEVTIKDKNCNHKSKNLLIENTQYYTTVIDFFFAVVLHGQHFTCEEAIQGSWPHIGLPIQTGEFS